MKVRSDDADIFYDVLGEGPAVVLLHAFPANHNLWRPVAERLATRYRVLLMDLRGHGESGVGSGPATMEKYAADVARVCDDAGIGKAVFGGVSIGGYVLFECWRRFRERIRALMLCDTRAQADGDDARSKRLQAAEDVEKNGPGPFLDALVPKLLGQSTRTNRQDIVDAARAMMRKMTVAGIAAAQRGMAARPDSVSTLPAITVPTLLLAGDEDTVTPIGDAEFMRQRIANSEIVAVPAAGHFAVFEQQDAAFEISRKWLDRLPR
jgi:pimeloyl-ACP methyl ester carboxylesterase